MNGRRSRESAKRRAEEREKWRKRKTNGQGRGVEGNGMFKMMGS